MSETGGSSGKSEDAEGSKETLKTSSEGGIVVEQRYSKESGDNLAKKIIEDVPKLSESSLPEMLTKSLISLNAEISVQDVKKAICKETLVDIKASESLGVSSEAQESQLSRGGEDDGSEDSLAMTRRVLKFEDQLGKKLKYEREILNMVSKLMTPIGEPSIVVTEEAMFKDVMKSYACRIIAASIGDLLEECKRNFLHKEGADLQIKAYKRALKLLYYEAGCESSKLKVNHDIVDILQSEDVSKGHFHLKGRAGKRFNDQDILGLCNAVRLGLRLKSLSLPYHNISDFGAWLIAYILQVCPTLKHLDLTGNSITGKGGAVIGEVLKFHQALKTLKLGGNKIENEGGLVIGEALTMNSTLQHLDLSSTDLRIESLIGILIGLCDHPTLKSINLNRPLLFTQQEEPINHLSHSIKINKVLKELHLQKFGMTDKGSTILAKGLMYNQTLALLDLSCNKIAWDGCKQLAEFLKVNQSVEVLNLHANRIESPGAAYIGKALPHNSKLKTLIITNNNISSDGMCALLASLSVNLTLSNLYVWGNKLGTAACESFKAVLEQGRLSPENVDVKPYEVDGITYLAASVETPPPVD